VFVSARIKIAAVDLPAVPHDPRRALPAVERVLAEPAALPLVSLYGRELVLIHLRRLLSALRERLAAGDAPPAVALTPAAILAELGGDLADAEATGLRRVLNATGVFLHTNLGRAPLPAGVARALPELLDAYCNLEFDLEQGRRGRRDTQVIPLLRRLTGAGEALVVNNNAGALVLAVAALAAGREVVISRGELVEIGGSFRVPDILAATGARLVEVGTTNRTRLSDYAQAIGPDTALLLKVHPSNYRISGFVASVSAGALATLGREKGVPLLVDEGSGLLRPHPAPQLSEHPSLAELLSAGADLVCGSGDKLLGGPQAGLLLGRPDLVERCRRHPFYRALRADRAAFATLEAVLRMHARGEALPIDGMWPEKTAHRARLERAMTALPSATVEIVPANAFLGGGAAPELPIPGEALAIRGAGDALQRALRQETPAVIGYLRDGRLVLDLRTVDARDDQALLAAVRRALAATVTP